MKYLLIILFSLLLFPQERPKPVEKLKRYAKEQKNMNEQLDSLLIKFKLDTVKKDSNGVDEK